MLAHNQNKIAGRVHATIDSYAERGLRSLGVARQVRQCVSYMNRRTQVGLVC